LGGTWRGIEATHVADNKRAEHQPAQGAIFGWVSNSTAVLDMIAPSRCSS
jgi:hypothetical protein